MDAQILTSDTMDDMDLKINEIVEEMKKMLVDELDTSYIQSLKDVAIASVIREAMVEYKTDKLLYSGDVYNSIETAEGRYAIFKDTLS